MTNERLPPGTYILGRIRHLSNGRVQIQPVHQETALLYQQKVQALIAVAREYANDPNQHSLNELKRIALAFAENS